MCSHYWNGKRSYSMFITLCSAIKIIIIITIDWELAEPVQWNSNGFVCLHPLIRKSHKEGCLQMKTKIKSENYFNQNTPYGI